MPDFSKPLDPNSAFALAETEFTPVPFGEFADFEIEYELIGSVLRQGSLYEELSGTIDCDKFHNVICSDIWKAMGRVREQGLILDSITVQDQLDRDGMLATIKYDAFLGRAAIGKLRERGNPKNVKSYVENVIDYWAKRQLDVIAQVVTTQSRNGRRAPDILSDLRVKIDALEGVGGKTSARTYSASSLASIAYDHAESAAEGKLKGIKLGFTDLDKLVTLLAGDLFLIAGRPGQGKSAFLNTVALNLSLMGKKIALFSLEMSAKQVAIRFLAQMAQVPTNHILEGKMTELEWPPYVHAVEQFEHLPLMINDMAGITVPQANSELRRMVRDLKGCDLVIVDYAQLMKSTKKVQRRDQEIGEISRGLKQIAKDFEVPVLAAAQMSRAVEQRSNSRPILSDLRESGDLENDSDGVMFIYRPEQNEKDLEKYNIAEIVVAKHRNGPVGSVELVFRGALTRFENAATKTFKPETPRDYTDF